MQSDMVTERTPELTSDQVQTIYRALEAMIDNPRFSKSRRYPALLRYIVDETLAGNLCNLKERIIGAQLFGRSVDYDTGSDPVVRVVLNELRKRLSLYNSEQGELPVVIDLPIGGYEAHFTFREARPQIEQISDEVSLAENEKKADANETAQETLHIAAMQRPPSHLGWFVAGILALLLAVSATTFIHAQWKLTHPASVLWQPIFSTHSEPLLVVGLASYPAAGSTTGTTQPAPAFDTAAAHYEKHKVGLGITMAVADIARYLGAHERTYRILAADKAFMTDLHGSPIILIGDSYSNPWLHELQTPLRYQIATAPDGKMQIVDTRASMQSTSWSAIYQGDTPIVSTDFSLVASFYSSVTDSPVLLIAGLNGFGAGTAGEMATSEEDLRAIATAAPKGWNGKQFEAVIRTDVLQSHPGHIQVVAASYW